MSLSSLATMMLLENHVMPFLEISDLPRLDGTDMSMHCECAQSSAWKNSAIHALPGFMLQPALFELSARKEFLKFFPSLAKANVMRGATVPVKTVDDAQRLSKLLGGANNSAILHMKNHGHSARVFLGCLRFQGESIAHALVEHRRGSEGVEDTAELEEPVLCTSLPMAVPVPNSSKSKHQSTSVQHPPDIEFGWQGGSLLVRASANLNLMEHSIGNSSVTVDIACMDPMLTLHQRGVEACTDGEWTPATSGICAFPKGRTAAAQSLTQGVLCVLCVKEGAPRISAPSRRISQALHLDELRSRTSGSID